MIRLRHPFRVTRRMLMLTSTAIQRMALPFMATPPKEVRNVGVR